MLPEPIAVTLKVTGTLEKLDVVYAIGGSMASSTFGEARSTFDADLLADLKPDHVPGFVAELRGAFYLSRDAIFEAVIQRRSFNIVHLETLFKVDIFVASSSAFDQAQLARRQYHKLAESDDAGAFLASAEDVVLAKIDWYRRGDCVSDRQWRDVLGILKIQSDRIDRRYLEDMARQMALTELLRRAFDESSSEC